MSDRWIVSNHKFFRHATRSAAEAEAKRLATVTDKEFRVYRIKTNLDHSKLPEFIDKLCSALEPFAEISLQDAGTVDPIITVDNVRAARRVLSEIKQNAQVAQREHAPT